MKHLVGKKQTKKVQFMDDEVEIKKLSISEVMEIQKLMSKKGKSDEMAILRELLKVAVVGAEEMTEEDFNSFPPGDLSTLSEEIMAYCGLGDKAKQAGN